MKALKVLPLLLLCFSAKGQPNCSAPATGLPPLNVLGTGIWSGNGQQGGLYPGGVNYRPTVHNTAGLNLASQVKCLDGNGNPDSANGRIVLLSIGMSNTSQEFNSFINVANSFLQKNPRLTIVNGAQGGQAAQTISKSSAAFWTNIDNYLANNGVTAQQVQAIWFKQADAANNITPQAYADSLIVWFKKIMNICQKRYPNLKLCYVSSRISARYASTTLNPEPYAYWQGWSVKWFIEDQIKGDSMLQYSGSNVNSPWICWGPYLWSDGSALNALTGLAWNCPADFQSDGTHPSGTGANKVANELLEFFTTDSTSIPWFLGTGCGLSTSEPTSADDGVNELIFPNPLGSWTEVKLSQKAFDLYGSLSFFVYNMFGEIIIRKDITGPNVTLIDGNFISPGTYFYKVISNFNNGREIGGGKWIVL